MEAKPYTDQCQYGKTVIKWLLISSLALMSSCLVVKFQMTKKKKATMKNDRAHEVRERQMKDKHSMPETDMLFILLRML